MIFKADEGIYYFRLLSLTFVRFYEVIYVLYFFNTVKKCARLFNNSLIFTYSLHREINAVYSKIRIEHINELCGQNIGF